MKMKKILLVALSLAVVAALAVGGTVAYFTSNDSDINVMTVGNVKIAQHEYERIVDENGNFVSTGEVDQYTYTPDKLQEFTPNKAALPAVYSGSSAPWSTRTGTDGSAHQQSWAQVGAPGSNQISDAPNVIDKFVFVENTGRTDAYYRTLVAVESADLPDNLIHIIETSNPRFNASEERHIGYTVIGGVRYSLFEYIYKETLAPGEVSRPSLLQVYLDKKATNADCAKLGDTWEILVVSQAVQASMGDMTAEEALDEAFYDVTVTENPWANPVSDVAELEAAIAEGQTNVIIDEDIALDNTLEVNGELNILGNGNTITAPAGGTRVVNATDNSEDVVINLTGVKLDGSDKERGISFYNNSGALDVNIVDCEVVANYYGVNVAGNNANANLTIKDSTLTGYCAFQTWSANTVATFDNCVFNGVNKYFNNAAYPHDNDFATITVNPGADNCVLTFNGCTITATEQTGDWAAKEYHLIDNSNGSVVNWNNCTFIYNGQTVASAIVK